MIIKRIFYGKPDKSRPDWEEYPDEVIVLCGSAPHRVKREKLYKDITYQDLVDSGLLGYWNGAEVLLAKDRPVSDAYGH